MSRPVDVLAELDEAVMRVEAIHGPTAVYALRQARAAVAELVAASEALARRADNNVRSCGEIEMDSPELKALHAHLAKTWSAA